MSWLEALNPSSDLPQRTLVLCRSSASASAVRRHLAGQGGQVGIEILTPTGLARSLEPAHLLPSEEPEKALLAIPPDHPWASVTGRAGLASILCGHLSDIRLEGVPGAELPTEVMPLLDLGWGQDPETNVLASLADRVEHESAGQRLGFDRVFAIGFGDQDAGLLRAPGTNRLFDRILKGLAAVRLSGPEGPLPENLPTVLASDVGAEAAWVVDEAVRYHKDGGRFEDVLVLVAGQDDRDRIRSALGRSGVHAAVAQSQRLTRHALAILVRSVLPWFDETSPDQTVIEGETLRRLFQNPLVGSGDYQPAEAAELRRQIALLRPPVLGEPDDTSPEVPVGEDDLYVSRRAIPTALIECHLVRASLDKWIASLAAVTANPGLRFGTRRAGLLLRQRLLWLRQSRGPTLGHVRTFLNRLDLHTFRDRVAMSIQKALLDAARRPATDEVLSEVLDGAASSGDFHRGVTLLDYAQYDRRPSGLCLLTGMHSKGVGQAPAPDPFFTDDVAVRWGRLGGADHVRFLMQQATEAAARAGIAKACVVQRSADGRAVVPVSHRLLRLVTDKPQTDLQNYGLQLQTPEASNRDALQGVPHPVPAEGPKEIGNAVADHAARMATVEWIRNGGTFVRPEASGDVEDDSTLQDIIARDWEAIPRSLRPYLGDASTTAVAALPANATLSVTGGFEPLSHCLFQAYLKTRLRLKEPDTLEEELNAREVGSAVHKALENIGIDPRWRPDAQQQESAVQSLTLDLSKEVTAQLETMLTKLPVVTPALEKARKGLGGRWERHLAMYVRSRVEDLQALGEKASKKSWSQFGTTLEYKELLGHRDAFFAVEAHKGHAKEWIRKAVEAILATTDPLGEETLVHCNSKSKPVVQQWISDPDVQARVHALAGIYASLLARESSIRGAVVGGKAEWKFGPLPDGEPAAPLMLQLGDTRDVLVRGSVDRVRVTEGSGGIRAVELLDYKTGRPFLRQVKEEIQAGTRPQLPLYALALLAARGFGKAPPDVPMEPVVLRLAYDFVQDVSNDGLFSWEPGDSSPSLEESAHLLGWLLALARSGQYPVLPHPLTCPVLKYRGHDYCPFRPACRFGQHPGTIVPTDDEPSEEVAE